MGNGCCGLSVMYLRKQVLPEGHAEPPLTCYFQRAKLGCHGSTWALAFGLDFGGTNVTYNHSLSLGAASTVPVCVPSGSSRYK